MSTSYLKKAPVLDKRLAPKVRIEHRQRLRNIANSLHQNIGSGGYLNSNTVKDRALNRNVIVPTDLAEQVKQRLAHNVKVGESGDLKNTREDVLRPLYGIVLSR